MLEKYLGSAIRHGLSAAGGGLIVAGTQLQDAAPAIAAGLISWGIGQLLSWKKIGSIFG